MTRLSWGAMASAALLGLVSGCDSLDTQRSATLRLTADTPEARDFIASFSDYEGNEFKAWWGPYSGTCAVNMTVHKDEASDHSAVVPPSVSSPGTASEVVEGMPMLLEFGTADCAYTVYIDGKFRGLPGGGTSAPTVAPMRAILIPVWPIVYANRIKIGVTGTKCFVHVDGDRHIVGRLKGGTGTVYVSDINNQGTTETIQPSSSEDRYVVFDPAATPPMSYVQAPVSGSSEAQIFAEVRRRHTVHQGAYPLIPDGP